MIPNFENRFQIESGKWIHEQADEYEVEARKTLGRLFSKWRPWPLFYHLRSGGHVAASHAHVGNSLRVRLDIDNFFGSISRNRVVRALKRVGFSYEEADDFARKSTVPFNSGFVLPFGFVQSTALATLVLQKSPLGAALKDMRDRDFTVTVYVDDIIISGDVDPSEMEKEFDKLFRQARRSRFSFSSSKIAGPEPSIRAFNLILSPDLVSVAEDRFSEFSEEVDTEGDTPKVRAILGYVKTVNQKQYDYLANLLTDAEGS